MELSKDELIVATRNARPRSRPNFERLKSPSHESGSC